MLVTAEEFRVEQPWVGGAIVPGEGGLTRVVSSVSQLIILDFTV